MKKLAIAFAMSMIVHSAAFAASGVVELKVIKAEDERNSCRVTVEAVNKTDVTFDQFSPKIRFMDNDQKYIDAQTSFFRSLRPGKSLSDLSAIKNIKCSEISSANIEAVAFCYVEGNLTRDCESLIALPAGVIKLTK